jgi:hypothetical protein
VPHDPSLQIPFPRPTQEAPGDMQMPATQQPLALQLLPSQQGIPAPPQVVVLPPAPVVLPVPLGPLPPTPGPTLPPPPTAGPLSWASPSIPAKGPSTWLPDLLELPQPKAARMPAVPSTSAAPNG